LAEYHVAVIGVIDATVLNIPDLKFNPIGSRGIGEIGITGSAAAVAKPFTMRQGSESENILYSG
jgi:xanthine dehydrogenase YagR molybdenum-binding subunit